MLLLELVAQGPHKLGIPFSNWTTSNFATELGKLIGTELTARHVETYLKANDWALQCPVRTVQHKQDPELVKEKKTDP